MPRYNRLGSLLDKAAKKNGSGKQGRLNNQRVQAKALARYTQAVRLFCAWVISMRLCSAINFEHLDDQASEYLEHLWFNGDSKLLAGDTLSGIQHFLRRKRILSGSWELYKAWNKAEVSEQVPPIPVFVLQALLGLAWSQGELGVVAVVACAFHCFLRTGEFLLVGSHNSFINEQFIGFLNLGFTKSGKRRGATEQVSIEDPLVGYLIQSALQISSNGLVFSGTSSAFRKLFDKFMAQLGLSHLNFKPYCLCRGGAVFHFSQHGKLDQTILRGRWESVRVAKLYINEGLLALTNFKFTEQEKAVLANHASLFKPF